MTMSLFRVIPFLGLTLSVATVAQQPSTATLGGPRVQGVCLLSQQAVVANAKVGLAATARLKQLAGKAQADVDAARSAIEAEAKTLESQRATMKPAEFQSKSQGLAARVQALQRTAQARSQQVELTRQKVLGQIAAAAQPVIAQVYKTGGCGLLVDRNAVLGGNMAGDLTGAVVQGLDAKLTTINFDLVPLPAQTASSSQ